MIDSEFCIRCGRPYAMYDIWYCDSCIKDMLYEGLKALNYDFAETSPNNALHSDKQGWLAEKDEPV